MYLTRRHFLKYAGWSTSGFALFSPMDFGPNDEVIIGHNDYKFKIKTGWGVLDSAKNPVNDCHEMVEDRQGRLLMLTNETRNNVLIYDKSGKLLDAWGTAYPGGHGFTLHSEGTEEFLYICDNTRHQVIKTDLKGNVKMKLEYPRETGVYDHPHQFIPTETAINPANGDIYVVDGYGLNYVIQYSARGEYIRHWGGQGTEKHQFRCCHGILVDQRNKNNPTLIITSRVDNCWKRFTLDGKYLSTISLPGSFICRPVIKGDLLMGAVFRSTSEAYPNSGYIQILDKNDRVISTPGGSMPEYKDGKLQEQRKDDPFKVFMHPHDVYMDSDHSIYVPQWASQKTYPVKLERV